MKRERVRDLLGQVADGSLSVRQAIDVLAFEPFETLSHATVDHHRALRQGHPEVIFGEGKTPEQVVEIAERIAVRGEGVLATRLAPEAAEALRAAFPEMELNPVARTGYLAGAEPPAPGTGTVCIVTAGTSDLPVAEEAAVTAAALGNAVARITDVGVAGLHRLLARREELLSAAVLIVVAGMDGALPSVVGGIAALLTMLNSCAAGVTVVNIDNGFGAAVAASRITHD